MSSFKMLKALRKKKNIKFAFALLAIIIVPAFLLWGAGSAIRSRRTQKYVGRIFNRKVPYEKYLESLRASRCEAIMKYGDNFFKLAKYLNLERQAWDRLILLAEAKRRRIKVNDEEVIKKIEEEPFFQKGGSFNKNLYEETLRYVFRTESRVFEEELRSTLMIAKLYRAITKDIKVDDFELKEKYKRENEKAKVEYIYIPFKNYEKDFKLSEEELRSYFQTHIQKFKKPWQVDVEYIGIDYPEGASDEKKEESLEKAQEIYSRLSKGESFKKISKEFSLPIRQTGFFGINEKIPRIGLCYEFAFAAFSQDVGKFSPPIKTPKGCYILKLKGKKAPHLASFNEVKSEVKKGLILEEAKKLAKSKAQESLIKIKKELKENPKLKFGDLAKKLGFKVYQTGFFKRGDYIAKIGKSLKFSQVSFALSEGELSKLVETNKGYCVLRLLDFIPVDKEKFALDKENFRKILLEKKKLKVFNAFFARLQKNTALRVPLAPPSPAQLP